PAGSRSFYRKLSLFPTATGRATKRSANGDRTCDFRGPVPVCRPFRGRRVQSGGTRGTEARFSDFVQVCTMMFENALAQRGGMGMPIIEAVGLTKTYRVAQKKAGVLGAVRGLFRRETKEVHAVQDVSFAIEPGEMVAFLGPNGAGKTTTLKMLSGLIYPTSGSAQVLGFVPWERADAFPPH